MALPRGFHSLPDVYFLLRLLLVEGRLCRMMSCLSLTRVLLLRRVIPWASVPPSASHLPLLLLPPFTSHAGCQARHSPQLCETLNNLSYFQSSPGNGARTEARELHLWFRSNVFLLNAFRIWGVLRSAALTQTGRAGVCTQDNQCVCSFDPPEDTSCLFLKA